MGLMADGLAQSFELQKVVPKDFELEDDVIFVNNTLNTIKDVSVYYDGYIVSHGSNIAVGDKKLCTCKKLKKLRGKQITIAISFNNQTVQPEIYFRAAADNLTIDIMANPTWNYEFQLPISKLKIEDKIFIFNSTSFDFQNVSLYFNDRYLAGGSMIKTNVLKEIAEFDGKELKDIKNKYLTVKIACKNAQRQNTSFKALAYAYEHDLYLNIHTADNNGRIAKNNSGTSKNNSGTSKNNKSKSNFWETFGKVVEVLSVGLDAATEYVSTYNQSGYSSGYNGSSAAGYSQGTGTRATVPTNYDNTFTTGNQVWYEKDNHNGTTTTWIVYPCLRCKGTKKCDFCHGAGQIALTSKVIQCRSCNGTGRCLECNERGQRVTMSVKDANGNGYITDNNGYSYDIAYLRAQEEVRREERQNENSTAEKSVPDVMTCDSKLHLYQTYVHSLEQMRGVARSTYYDNDRRKQIQRDMIKLREEMSSMGCSTYVDPIESWNGD